MLDLAVSGALAAHLFLATPAPTRPDEPLFTADAIRAHLEFLADDLLEGREPGTRGFDVAALYVATRFRAAGLEPVLPEGWYQHTALVERTPNATADARLTIGDLRFDLGEHVLAAISGEGAQTWNGEAVFVGYGLADPDGDLDAWRDVDVRGKAVVLYDRAPASLAPGIAEALSRRRTESIHQRGAAGVITLVDGQAVTMADWASMRAGYAQPFFNWVQDDGQPFRRIPMRFSAILDPVAAAALFEGAPVALADLDDRVARGEALPSFPLTPRVAFETVNQWRRYSSPNVVGRVRGSEPGLAGECIVVTSHLDAFGVDPAAAGDDKIFNGALDNASGVAALIETARAMAGSIPRRSVVFTAVTAEEVGLLGSDHLAARGVPGCDRIVAVVNLDGGVPPHELPEAIAYGGWHSTIGPVFEAVAAANGIAAGDEDTPPTDFFERTDHFSFVRRGVPGIYLVMSSGDDVDAEAIYRDHVHQPTDDLTLPFNWAGGARFARLAHDLIRALADADEAPRWYADSPVGQRYAPDQPKAARP